MIADGRGGHEAPVECPEERAAEAREFGAEVVLKVVAQDLYFAGVAVGLAPGYYAFEQFRGGIEGE